MADKLMSLYNAFSLYCWLADFFRVFAGYVLEEIWSAQSLPGFECSDL